MSSCGRLFVMVLTFSCAVSHGQEPVELDTLKVQSGSDNWADSISPEDAYGSVTEISAEAFRHGAGTLSDVLKKHTLMTLRQAGGLGSVSAFSVRGASSKQTLVLVDGMVVNNPMFGGVDLNQFTLGNIDRITLYSDVAPAIVSQGAIGGVIALETAKDDREETRVTLGAGSFGTYKGSLSSSVNLGKTHHAFSYFQQGADNDYPYPNHRDWWNPNDGPTSYKRNAEFEEEQLSLKSRYRLGEQSAVDLLLEKQSQERGIPSVQNWASNKSHLSGDHQRLQVRGSSSAFMDGRLHMSQRFLISRLDESYDNRQGFIGVGSQYIGTEYRQYTWAQSLAWLDENSIYTLATDISQYEFSQRNLLANNSPYDERTRDQISAALSHELFFQNTQLSLLSSIRWTGHQDDSQRVALSGAISGVKERNDFWYGSLSARYRMHSGYTVTLSASRDIRLATLQEKYGQWGSFVGNDDLDREEATRVSLNVARKQDRYRYQLDIFARHLEPGFVAIYDARGVGRYMPMQAEYHGLEWQGEITLHRHFLLRNSLAWMDTENTSRLQSHARGKPVPGVYHWQFTIGPRYEHGKFHAELIYRHDDSMYYDAANLLRAQARQVLDVELGLRFQQCGSFSLSIRNVMDNQFQDFNRYPSPGRHFFVSYDIKL